MINMIQNAKDQVLALTLAAYRAAADAGKLPGGVEVRANVEIPKDTANGDYTTTFALAAAKAMKKSPRDIASILMENMDLAGSYFSSVEIAGAGFLNFRLGSKWFADVLSAVESEGDRYGLKLTYSWRDALWTACMMNTFIRSAESVGITNLAQMVNVIAPIVANAEGSFAQPTYHVLRLYREMVSGAQADCLMDNAPLIDAGEDCSVSAIDCAAAVRADGTIILSAANISETEAYELRLAPGLRAEGALCLEADSFGATNAIGRESVRCVQKSADEALVLEPGTISMITIKK